MRIYAGELLGTTGFFSRVARSSGRGGCVDLAETGNRVSKTKFERNSSQEYYDITYIGKTYKLSRSVFPCEIFVLSKLSSLSHLS